MWVRIPKQAILLGFATLLSIAPVHAQKPYNFAAPYSDFESDWDGDGVGDGWESIKGPAGLTLVNDRTIASTGTRSQRVDVNLPNASGSETVSFSYMETMGQPGSILLAGTRVTVAFSMKTSANPTNVCLRVVGEYGVGVGQSGTVDLLPNTTVAANTNWARYSAEFQIPLAMTYFRVRFVIQPKAGAASGSLWFDDFLLTDGRPALQLRKFTIKNHALYSAALPWDIMTFAEYFEGGRFGTSAVGLQQVRTDGVYTLMNRFNYTDTLRNDAIPDNVFEWSYISASHPEWILKDAQGNNIAQDRWIALDIGSATYQQEWLARTLIYVDRMRPKWMFFDAIDIHAAHNMAGVPAAKYPTDVSWQAAMTNFLQAVMPALHSAGVKVLLNMAHTDWYEEPGKSWTEMVDGTLFELGVVHSDAGFPTYDPYTSWKQKFLSQVYRSDRVYVIADRALLTTPDPRRYGIATFLLGASPNSQYAYCTGGDIQVWHSDLEVNLGNPTETYQLVQGVLSTGGLFKRAFENGLVLVNPHDTNAFTYNLASAYTDLDGNIVGPGNVTLQSKQARILLKVARVTLSLVASPSNPKPGDTVTYTLSYGNVGSQRAYSPVIALPLPLNLSLVANSISGGGTYSSSTRIVTWLPAFIDPGQSGTLTCQAKVN